MIMIPIVLLPLLLYGLVSGSRVQYSVPCDATNSVCECPENTVEGRRVEVCVFTLEVMRLQTFSRYSVDPTTGRVSPHHGASVWYINDTSGDYLPFDPADGNVCSRVPLSDTATCTSPLSVDGYTFRSLVTINGHSPGPTLIVHYNQTLLVNVTNSLLSQSFSIHWHGLHQRNTNWMDGVARLTQCGIAPGNSFTYIFQANPTGTFWYHSHVGSLRVDGGYGALIINEPAEVIASASVELGGAFIDTPSEHTLLMQEFFQESFSHYALQIHSGSYFFNLRRPPDPKYNSLVDTALRKVDNTFVSAITFRSALINGKGRHPALSYTKSRLSTFTVSPSQRYRFRVVGALATYGLRVSVDEHKLIVISTDGVLLKPVTVDFLYVHSAERYDFIIETESIVDLGNKRDFMIRAETLETIPSSNSSEANIPVKGRLAEAILHYNLSSEPLSSEYASIASNSIPVDDRCTSKQPCKALNCFFKDFPESYNTSCINIHQLELLNPIEHDLLPNVKPDEQMILNFGFEGSGQTSSVNTRKSTFPFVPLSVAKPPLGHTDYVCKGLEDPSYCNDTFDVVYSSECICAHIRNVTHGPQISVQIVLTNIAINANDVVIVAHPVHIHGHYLYVVHTGYGDYTSNGWLEGLSKDITCKGGQTKGPCNVPSWSKGSDYSLGRNGKISNTAPLKDTVVIPPGGYVVAYLVPDNPGYWLMHCHIADHLVEGMGVVISEGVDRMSQAPTGMSSQCGHFVWDVEKYYDHQRQQREDAPATTVNNQCTSSSNYYAIITVLSLLVCALVLIQIVLCIVCCYR